MEKPKDTVFYKGYTQGYLDGYRDGVKDNQRGTDTNLLRNDIAKLPIEAMEITTRAYNCLIRMGCKYVSDLLYLSEANLQRARRLCTKTAEKLPIGWTVMVFLVLLGAGICNNLHLYFSHVII